MLHAQTTVYVLLIHNQIQNQITARYAPIATNAAANAPIAYL